MKNNELDAFINGYTVHGEAKEDDDDKFGKVGQAYSSNLDDLDRPNSVLLLDEYSRQTDDQIRGSVLSLINEHYVAGRENGKRYFPNFLFTVAIENPSVPGEAGVVKVGQAEKTRFPLELLDANSDPKDTAEYLLKE